MLDAIPPYPRLPDLSTESFGRPAYMVTSLMRNRNPLGPFRRPMPRVLGVS